jgi:hypothetical protein
MTVSAASAGDAATTFVEGNRSEMSVETIVCLIGCVMGSDLRD